MFPKRTTLKTLPLAPKDTGHSRKRVDPIASTFLPGGQRLSALAVCHVTGTRLWNPRIGSQVGWAQNMERWRPKKNLEALKVESVTDTESL